MEIIFSSIQLLCVVFCVYLKKDHLFHEIPLLYKQSEHVPACPGCLALPPMCYVCF